MKRQQAKSCHHIMADGNCNMAQSHLQVRGKTVYLQYSTRDQIINSTARTGEATGNVILVSLENLDVRTRLSCSHIHSCPV